jgi:sigma-B regulation protein RsbU (phosphoserine phosphatase)
VKTLIIDDAADIRIYLRALLGKWGYETHEASDGIEGIARIKESDIPLVVCDWAMPGMSGPELCRAVREAGLPRYVYIILLTGRSEKADLVEGLNAGADDFLSKPFDAQVLQARLRVAERILRLEQRLAEQNRELRDSRDRLEYAYGQIQADLALAARVQLQMLPTSDRVLAPLRAEWLFLPAAQVSGDSFGFFELTPERIGFFHLDVSGHGIPSALLSASLSRALSPGGAPGAEADAHYSDPARCLAELNRQFGAPDTEVENFATIAYGILDKGTGETAIALAGHPLPIVLRRGGEILQLQPGGLPVGMFPEVGYESQTLQLAWGDRLILYSDGVTESQNPAGEAFGAERLTALLAVAARTPAARLTTVLADRLRQWRGGRDFEDDISVLILERPVEPDDWPGADASAEVQLEIESDPMAVPELQTRLMTLCAEAGFVDLDAFQLTCAIVEAVNNCIEHAYGGRPGQPISLCWRAAHDGVTVEIRDRGAPLTSVVPETTEATDTDALSGRGWHIIRQWTDGASYRREGDENLLTLTRRP